MDTFTTTAISQGIEVKHIKARATSLVVDGLILSSIPLGGIAVKATRWFFMKTTVGEALWKDLKGKSKVTLVSVKVVAQEIFDHLKGAHPDLTQHDIELSLGRGYGVVQVNANDPDVAAVIAASTPSGSSSDIFVDALDGLPLPTPAAAVLANSNPASTHN